MRVAIIGAGYVGLVSGACFADFGLRVTCVDKDAARINALNGGRIPIFEPGLDELVEQNVRAGRLSFTTEMSPHIGEADVVFIAVGTPSRRGNGYADLRYVHAAAEEIAPLLRGYTVVVNKSTVPVGTGDEVETILARTVPAGQFDVVSNPEFLREGAAIDDFKRPDRVIVGAESERAFQVMRALYRPLFLTETPILETGRRTAELTKYAANSFLAMKIGFINEMADLCEAVGANVQEVARGIGLDKRIGAQFLHPGPGYGGSCFPKDTLALSRTAEDAGSPLSIVNSVIRSNDRRKKRMVQRIVTACGGSVAGKTIAVLGLTFKPDTDDMRLAPSLVIVPGLQRLGARIRAFDPEGMEQAARLLKKVEYAKDPYECMRGADVAVILTEWDQFRAMDPGKMAELLRERLLVDLRNIYSPSDIARSGLAYVSVGRPAADRAPDAGSRIVALRKTGAGRG